MPANRQFADPRLSSQSNPRQRILVVDDEEDIRRLNTGVLRSSGYEVDDAEDGAAAWHALQLKSYDLLITDNKMPKITGAELLKKIHAAGLMLPVIMASETYLPELPAWKSLWQIEAILPKPYNFDDLLVTVKNILGKTADKWAGNAPPPNGASQPVRQGSQL